MTMRPANVERPFLPVYRWIAPLIAIAFFIGLENFNAASGEFAQSGIGYHAGVVLFSLVAGAVTGVGVTALAIVAWILLGD